MRMQRFEDKPIITQETARGLCAEFDEILMPTQFQQTVRQESIGFVDRLSFFALHGIKLAVSSASIVD